MAGLINTAPGYMAQMVGQLMIEKAELLGRIDKLEAEIEQLKAPKPESEPAMAGDDLHR